MCVCMCVYMLTHVIYVINSLSKHYIDDDNDNYIVFTINNNIVQLNNKYN